MTVTKCRSCGAPPGECWSQAASMGGHPYCARDDTVGMSHSELQEEVKKLRVEVKRLTRFGEKTGQLLAEAARDYGEMKIRAEEAEAKMEQLKK